jgi:antitoxin HigA-1
MKKTTTTKTKNLVSPGEILLEEFLKPMGISINLVAREIGVPPTRISEIVNGRRAITADTALRLGKYFGMSPEIWMGLQSDYDLRMIRRDEGAHIEGRVHPLSTQYKVPVSKAVAYVQEKRHG